MKTLFCLLSFSLYLQAQPTRIKTSELQPVGTPPPTAAILVYLPGTQFGFALATLDPTTVTIDLTNPLAPVVKGQPGPPGPTINFADGEVPGGAVDGVNTSFTLANTPNPAASLKLFRNGLLQKAGFDYTLAGKTVSFVAPATPQATDTLLADYRF